MSRPEISLQVVKFVTIHGTQITIESSDFTYVEPTIGKKVKVTYDLDDPQNAFVSKNQMIAFNLFLLIFILSILTFLAIGIFKLR